MSDDRILDRAGWIPGPPTREGYYWVWRAYGGAELVGASMEYHYGPEYLELALVGSEVPVKAEEYKVLYHFPIPVPEGPEDGS